jgi:DNA (cytosine-5)-methyltransferase 1
MTPADDIITPDIVDAERLQGFPAQWTTPAIAVSSRRDYRWKLVGNAVTVPIAEWVGGRLRDPGRFVEKESIPIKRDDRWPRAAWNVGAGRHAADISPWPVAMRRLHLHDFMSKEGVPLSHRAAAGFLSRLEASALNVPPRLLRALRSHVGTLRRRA